MPRHEPPAQVDPLTQAQAMFRLGRGDEALALADAALRRAQHVEDLPAQGHAMLCVAGIELRLFGRLGHYRRAMENALPAVRLGEDEFVLVQDGVHIEAVRVTQNRRGQGLRGRHGGAAAAAQRRSDVRQQAPGSAPALSRHYCRRDTAFCAARTPLRTAPSSTDGYPVSVQSPANMMRSHGLFTPGRPRPRTDAKVARLSMKSS